MAKTVDKRVNVWLNGQGIENNLKSVRAAILKTTNELAKLPAYSEEWYQASQKLSKLKGIYAEMGKEIAATGDDLKNAAKENDNFILKLGSISSLWQTASGAVRRFIGATQEYVEAYAAMDDAMSAVQKTTGMTREEVEKLNNQLKNIDTRTSQEELLKIAEIGGRLGLAKGDIEAFTESVNVANVALGDSFGGGAEEIASVLGKIRGAFQETKDADIGKAFQSIGSALNSVGATCAATEGNVAQFAQRLGALPDAMKPTIQDAIGLGAAFENASINAEVAATAYGQLMTKAASNLDAFAVAMGKPIEEVRELINTNPTEFMLQFAESFKGVPADQLGAKLKELKLNAVGVQEAIGAMSGQTDKFREILSVSNQSFADGTSMMEEYSTVNNNAAAQLEKAKKRMQDLKVELGEKLIPVITELYEKVNSGAKFISQHIGLIKSIAIALGLWISTIGLYKSAQIASNSLIAISNGLHKVHRLSVLASAAAQALFSQNVTRAKAATVLMSKELPILTTRLNTLRGSMTSIGNSLKSIMKLGPAAFLAGIAAAVIYVNKKANEGKKIVDDVNKAATEALAKGRADIEMEKREIDSLREIINSETASREQKYQAITELQGIIPDYVAELSEEGRVISENTSAIDNYIERLEDKLLAEIEEDKLRELMAKREEIAEEKAKKRMEYDRSLWKKMWYDMWYDMGDYKANRFYKELSDIDDEILKIESHLDGLNNKNFNINLNIPTQRPTTGIQHDPGNPNCQCSDCIAKRRTTKTYNVSSSKKTWAEFKKEVDKFRSEMAESEKNDWEKTKERITSRYEELINQAKKYGKKGKELAVDLENEKFTVIVNEGKKFLKKSEEFLKEFNSQISDMLSDSINDDGNTRSALVTAFAGSDDQWDNAIESAKTNKSVIDAILKDMDDNAPERLEFEEMSSHFQQIIDDAYIKRTEAKIAITKKFINEEERSISYREREIQREKELMELTTEEERAAKQREWEISDRQEEYDIEIKLMEAALAAKKQLGDEDEEGIRRIEDFIARLRTLREEVGSLEATKKNPQKTGNPLIDLLNGSITDPKERFKAAVDALQDFANQATDIYRQIADSQRQSAELELQKYEEAQDAKSRKLKDQLDNGIISQKYYDAQIEKMEKDREEKEKKLKHDQFERERKSSIVEIIIQGAISVARAFAEYAWPWSLIPAAMATAQTAAQAAIVGSQVNPYARGGFITKKQLALMGEEGKEWVASNMLLEDKNTAPIIAALENYQRGDRNALELLQPAEPDWKLLSQSANKLSTNFASVKTPIVNNYYTTSSQNDELLAEVKRMNSFLQDPKNRQAYISYKIQTEANTNREFIKKASAL